MRWIPILLISIGYIIFIINWAIDKEKSFFNDYISYYANSKYKSLTKSAFIATGSGVILSSNIYNNKFTLLNITLFIYGILLVILGLFTADTKDNFTFHGFIHNISAHLCFDAFILVFIYLIFTRNRSEIYSIILTSISAIAGLLIIPIKYKIKGLLQKISISAQLLLIIMLLKDKLL